MVDPTSGAFPWNIAQVGLGIEVLSKLTGWVAVTGPDGGTHTCSGISMNREHETQGGRTSGTRSLHNAGEVS